MKKIIKKITFLVLAGFLVSCTNDGHAPGGGDVAMPLITNSVNGGASLMSIQPLATTGAPLNTQSCTGCGANFANAWSLASTFILQGKMADSNSCIIKNIIKYDIVPGITSGDYVYMYNSNLKIKGKVETEGSTIKSFNLYFCDATSQVQYLHGTNTNGDVTFSMRAKGGATTFVTMDATGKMVGEAWTEKSLDVGFYYSGSYNYFTITQGTDYFDITGFMDSSTLGTLDGTDVQLVSRAQLIGNNVQNYAMGDGAIKYATGGGGSSTTNWNGDSGAEGGGPTTYDSYVTSATLPPAPSTQPQNFTTDETWDCQMVGTGLNLDERASGNSAFMGELMTCMETFQ